MRSELENWTKVPSSSARSSLRVSPCKASKSCTKFMFQTMSEMRFLWLGTSAMNQGPAQEPGVAIPKAIQNTIRLEYQITERCPWYQIHHYISHHIMFHYVCPPHQLQTYMFATPPVSPDINSPDCFQVTSFQPQSLISSPSLVHSYLVPGFWEK